MSWRTQNLLGALLLLIHVSVAGAATIYRADTAISAGRYCPAFELRSRTEGGGLDLLIGVQRIRIASDVTAVAWIDSTRCVFTVSPVYGVPGIYEWRRQAGSSTRLVSPGRITKAYPDGADWFELVRVSRSARSLFFKHVPDVDTKNLEAQVRRAPIRRLRL